MRFLALLALTAFAVARPEPIVYNGTTIILEASKTILDSGISTYHYPTHGPSDLRARQINENGKTLLAGVYVCDGPGFKNNCHWRQLEPYACITLPAWPLHYAFGPDKGIQCRVFESVDCTFGAYGGDIIYPGRTDWQGYEAMMAAPSAYQCHFCDKAHQLCGFKPDFVAGPW